MLGVFLSLCKIFYTNLLVPMSLFRDFPRPDLGPNIGAPSQFKNEENKPAQNDVYHSQFPSSSFW